MPPAFVLMFCMIVVTALPSSARGATLTGEVDVQWFARGTDIDMLLIERSPLTSWPEGAHSIALTTHWTGPATAPTFVAGQLIVTDTSGGNYLSGVLDAATLSLNGPFDFNVTSQLTPDSGSALAYFGSPAALTVTGSFELSGLGSAQVEQAFRHGYATVSISPVPVPGALPLFVTALGAVALWRRSGPRPAS